SLEREKEERKERNFRGAAFKRQLASLREKCTSIEAEIEHTEGASAHQHLRLATSFPFSSIPHPHNP
ncbi:hypothetical protein Hypma_004131, partial [Hypsizygus marmoreus]